MQVTKGTWRMREQCVPGSLSSSHAQEPGNEAKCCIVLKKDEVEYTTSKPTKLKGKVYLNPGG